MTNQQILEYKLQVLDLAIKASSNHCDKHINSNMRIIDFYNEFLILFNKEIK